MPNTIKKLSPLGKCLRKLRIDADCSQKEFAAAMSVSSAYISAVEMGNRTPSEALITMMAAFLESRGAAVGEKIRVAAHASTAKVQINFGDFKPSFRTKLYQLMEQERK